MAYTHKMVNGKRVELTAEEITALETRDTAWAAGAFDRAMANLRRERKILPRASIISEKKFKKFGKFS